MATSVAGCPRPNLLAHGAIGNGRVLALIAPTSAIEWLCLPYFDSPAIFARILDTDAGGTFRVLAGTREVHGQLAYLPNTNVLRTAFEADGCAWEIIDFAPLLPKPLDVDVPFELVRLVRPLRGQPRLSVDFDPRPDYARRKPTFTQTTHGLEVGGCGVPMHLSTNLPVPFIAERREFVLTQPLFFVCSHGRRDHPASLEEVDHMLERTIASWRAWARSCALPNFAPGAVLRSALCLKLHVCHDTGAIIAAATTSIPEALGTPRTWDYRYCWLRDAAFVVEALRRLSHLEEGERFIAFLRNVAEAGPLRPVYSIAGAFDLDEVFLTHLAGFCGNGHVRIGNAAWRQRQNDLMGEMLLCLHTMLTDPRLVHDRPGDYWPLVERLVEEAIAAAPSDDTGIWEFRSLLRPHTFSRAMCWVAIRRGADLAHLQGRHQQADRWAAVAASERNIVLTRSFNRARGFFAQTLDGEFPDAANLLLATLGIVDAKDPRFVSTLAAFERDLVEHGLMLRYRNPDDFGWTTSAFTICSFWWAEALALVGRLDDAIAVFNRLLTYANPVGLFSEDIDPGTGALLGNFPQAYTHVGLIHAAMTIGELLEARDGTVRAWT